MTLGESIKAIGEASRLLASQLKEKTSSEMHVDVTRPESSVNDTDTQKLPKFNLFLYQVDIDPHLRSVSIDDGQPAPLWLVLNYLLTAIDVHGETDSSLAHDLLGEGMLALHELNFLEPGTSNLESLKITFDSANVDLLSKLMQGSDEKYRCSAAFEVRPIMIAPTSLPSYGLPIKTRGQPGSEEIKVSPSLGPQLTSIDPQIFEAGNTITLNGSDLSTTEPDTEVIVEFGGHDVLASSVGGSEVVVDVPPPPAPALPTGPSAGSQSISIVHKNTISQRRVSSSVVTGRLLPTLSVATPASAPATDASLRAGTLALEGERMGGSDDTIFVAFYRDGATALNLQATGTADQRAMTVEVKDEKAIPPGEYFVILRVNGEQASQLITVTW